MWNTFLLNLKECFVISQHICKNCEIYLKKFGIIFVYAWVQVRRLGVSERLALAWQVGSERFNTEISPPPTTDQSTSTLKGANWGFRASLPAWSVIINSVLDQSSEWWIENWTFEGDWKANQVVLWIRSDPAIIVAVSQVIKVILTVMSHYDCQNLPLYIRLIWSCENCQSESMLGCLWDESKARIE